MKNLSRFSRREFVTLAAAGLSLAVPKGLLAFAQKESTGKAHHLSARMKRYASQCTFCERAARAHIGLLRKRWRACFGQYLSWRWHWGHDVAGQWALPG